MSGDNPLSRAAQYRARAEDLRTLAEELKSKEREALLQVVSLSLSVTLVFFQLEIWDP